MKKLDEWTVKEWKMWEERILPQLKQATKDLKEDNDAYDKKVKEEKE